MSYVSLARREADILAEGGAAAGTDNGYYVRPLVVTGLDSSHPLIQEEIFGPVMGVVQADDFEDAIRLCNDSIYGLSASLFTAICGSLIGFWMKRTPEWYGLIRRRLVLNTRLRSAV